MGLTFPLPSIYLCEAMDDPTAQAIKSSLQGNWIEAIKLNSQILKTDPGNIPALSRLGKAYTEQGKIKEAISTYQKVLHLDSFNSIARKNLDRLKSLKPSRGIHPKSLASIQSISQFLEEPGKTKTIALVKLAPPQVLLRLDPGDKVNLIARQHSISIDLDGGTTIGRLPDDVSARLLPMIKGGNTYSAVIRSATPTSARVLVREEKRGKKFTNTPSFPHSESFSHPFLSLEKTCWNWEAGPETIVFTLPRNTGRGLQRLWILTVWLCKE